MIADSQRENTKLVLNELFGLWDKRSELYGKVFVGSAVAKRYDKKWRNLTTFLFPMHKSEVRNSGLHVDYGDFKIIDTEMSLDDAKKVLSQVVEQDRLCLPGLPEIEMQVSLHQNSSKQFQHSGRSRFPLFSPHYEFNFNVDQDYKGEVPHDAVYSVDLPAFPSGAAAIQSYLCTRLGDSNQQHTDVLSALVPDYRGKIEQISIGTNSVQVEVECLAGSSQEDLIGKMFVKYYGGISITADLNFTNYKASAEIRDFPRDLLIVLLSRKEGELVDRKSFLAGSQYVTEGVTIEAPEQDMEQIIQMGESETVEFKREIPQQREQIAIGATALANRRGGRMFVGVADDCSIFGCKMDKPKDTLMQILRAYCDPPLDVVIDEVQIRNLPVIVLTIPEGKDKPYTVKEKGTYIRTGSNRRLISRYELDEIYKAKQGGLRSLYL